jgi:hypothetical protein
MHQQFPRRASSAATFLQPAQVAAILQVSPKTISRWPSRVCCPPSAPWAATAATRNP